MTWSMRERFAMPQVRTGVVKFALALLVSLLLFSAVLFISRAWILAVPIFHSEHAALYQDQWKAKTGCLPMPARPQVIFDCTQTNFTINHNKFLNETIARTFVRLVDAHPELDYMLYNTFDCFDGNGRCRSYIFTVINTFSQNQALMFSIAWLSTPVLMCAFAFLRFTGRYYKKMRHLFELQSAESVVYSSMSSSEKDQYLRAFVTPPPLSRDEDTHHIPAWSTEDEALPTSTAKKPPHPSSFDTPSGLFGFPSAPPAPPAAQLTVLDQLHYPSLAASATSARGIRQRSRRGADEDDDSDAIS